MQALRSLRRERTSSLLALLCLSIAIGTNTTVFSIVNGLMLRELPLENPERLVLVQERADRNPSSTGPVSYAVFQDLSSQTSEIMDLAAEHRAGLRISDGAAPERYAGSLASWNLFGVLGVRPALGRAFVDADDRPGAPPVVILSHPLWQQRYEGDPSILGRTILIGDAPHTVVGVMPRDLSHVALRGLLGSRLWVPLGTMVKPESGEERQLRVYGLLRAGVTQAAAGSRLESAARHLKERHALSEGWGVSLEPLRLGFSTSTQATFVMLMGAVSMVLLIACANLANLTLARTSTRRRELATRLALGASRLRVALQIVVESLIVALASVPPGIVLAFWGRSLVLGSSAGPEIYEGIPIDANVLLYTIALAMLATVLAGLLPAILGVRRLNVDVLRTGSNGAAVGVRHSVLSRILIGAEVTLAMILLVGALVFLKSFRTTMRADGGFDTSRILVLQVETADEFEDPGEASLRRLFAIVDRAAAVPGVQHVAAGNLMPLRDGGARASIVTDSPVPPPTPSAILLGGVTARFFDVLGVPVVQGRALTEAEGRSTAPVAVVNRKMAERLWPGESAVGRRFRPTARDTWFTVVGVSENILNWDLSDRPLPTAYVPYPHVVDRDPRLFVRTAGDPAAAAPALRAATYEAAPATPIVHASTMTEVHRMALGRHLTLARLFGLLGGIALLLGVVGVYGMLSYFVSQRTAEIGIRAALGAQPRSLVALFVKQGVMVAALGVAAGVPAAWAVARVLRGRIYNVSPPDALIFAAVSALLLAVALAAAYVPARRAATVDPLIAFRQ